MGDSAVGRVLTQIQFTDWPDHGVPQHAISLLAIRHTVKSLVAHDQYILVHCRYQRSTLLNAAVDNTAVLQSDHLIRIMPFPIGAALLPSL